jgi:hypothetical protein
LDNLSRDLRVSDGAVLRIHLLGSRTDFDRSAWLSIANGMSTRRLCRADNSTVMAADF